MFTARSKSRARWRFFNHGSRPSPRPSPRRGGFTERAAKRRVVVTRKDENGREKTFDINVVRIQNNRLEDFQLQEGDTIYVPDTIF